MLNEVINSNSLLELSVEEQEYLSAGGCYGRGQERPPELPPGYDKYFYHHVDVFPQSGGSPTPTDDFGGQNNFGGGNPGSGGNQGNGGNSGNCFGQ